MSVDDALKRYDSLVERAFCDGKKRIGDGKFRASVLEDVFKKIIRDAKGDAELRMMDSPSDEHVCKTYVRHLLLLCSESNLVLGLSVRDLRSIWEPANHLSFAATELR
jgi:hypothetical protein